MSDALRGKVAIVVGAGRGLGADMARTLAGAGAAVGVFDLNPDRADRVTAAIGEGGGQAISLQGSIANRFQVAAMIEQTRAQLGGLDILVQNAHAQPQVAALTMDEWDLRRTVEVNLIGSYFCGQLAGRVMAEQGRGAIIFLYRPYEQWVDKPGYSAFAASQASLPALARSFAAELGAAGVIVQAVPVTESHARTIETVMGIITARR